jgi:catechol 1,2-dioxygenase
MLDGYKPMTTQIFDSKSKYLDNDSVFAVKDSLRVDFVPRKGDPKAELELEYDVYLVPNDEKGGDNAPLVTGI